MRVRALLVGGSGALLLAACSLEWDSLQSSPDDPLDSGPDQPDTRADSPRPDSPYLADANEAAASDADDGGDSSLPEDASVPDTSIPDASVPDSSVLCAFTFSGTLATYDFTGEPGTQASTAAKSSVAGITAGSISRSGSIVAQVGLNSINGSNWGTSSSLDGTRYYTLTLTPAAKCALDLKSVSIDTKASVSGPANAAIATSDDSFVKTTAFAPSSVTSVSLSVSGSTSAVEIRIYGYNAASSAGTFRVENTLTVTGALK